MNGDLLVKAAIWVFSLIMALVFIATGIGKLAGIEAHLVNYSAWNFPQWGLLALGGVEIVGGIFLLVPRWAFLSAGLLCLDLLVSGALHFAHDEPSLVLRALILGFILLALCYLRLKQRYTLSFEAIGTRGQENRPDEAADKMTDSFCPTNNNS
ncbi:DoxX family protein [Luteithermobacter gelatinilyticus]|uniref:DoxX family protein n=1 Tax=Luteithermobacter gelatinilyticus TaxID=2582913 RepID=UPI00110613E9|nr:DoxX family protein [Luteithermobacter gelatinilyticus]